MRKKKAPPTVAPCFRDFGGASKLNQKNKLFGGTKPQPREARDPYFRNQRPRLVFPLKKQGFLAKAKISRQTNQMLDRRMPKKANKPHLVRTVHRDRFFQVLAPKKCPRIIIIITIITMSGGSSAKVGRSDQKPFLHCF